MMITDKMVTIKITNSTDTTVPALLLTGSSGSSKMIHMMHYHYKWTVVFMWLP